MTRLIWMLALLGQGCLSNDAPPPPPEAPAGCVQASVREQMLLTVRGTVVDFATGAPVAGATVELGTAWEFIDDGHAPGCPLLGSAVTDAAGQFGPLQVWAGSSRAKPIVLFTVRGAGRAPTRSDATTCADDRCALDHTIAAPSAELVASWRAGFAPGTPAVPERGLIVFAFSNLDHTAAAGVRPYTDGIVDVFSFPGRAPRFLESDRATLAPVEQTTTTTTGVAVLDPGDDLGSSIDIAGRRGAEEWLPTGCLLEAGYVFVEDRGLSAP